MDDGADDDDLRGEADLSHHFRTPAILVPEPLAFPRAAFAGALAEHADILRRHVDSLRFALRARWRWSTCEDVDALTGWVARTNDGETAHVVARWRAAERLAEYRAIHRALLAHHEAPSCMRVVVMTDDAISLHVLDATRVRGALPIHVAIASGDPIVEPFQQRHWESGHFTITQWSVDREAERRYAWVRTPMEPETEDEAVDRTMALYADRIRRLIDRARPLGGGRDAELVVLASSFRRGGDQFELYSLDRAKGSQRERVRRVVDMRARPGFVPVLFHMGSYRAVGWIALDTAAEQEPPRGFIDKPLRAADPNDTVPPDGEPPPWSGRPSRKPGIARQHDIDAEVGRLATSSDAELDAEIVLAGFEPSEERSATHPGLRECVVAAINERYADPNFEPPVYKSVLEGYDD